MADTIIASGSAETPCIDTVSYYDDSEPNWNERPYFTKIEEKRGRAGCHIDVANKEFFKLKFDSDHFAATPVSGIHRDGAAKQFAALVTSKGYRVVLSGTGGDEVTGGVPTPIPELEDLIARARLRTLAHQLKMWALNKRKPWFHIFFDAVRAFFPPTLVGVQKHKRPAPWLNAGFVRRNRSALQGYQTRVKLLGPLPTFQENLGTLDVLRRQLECEAPPSEPHYEKRYPYVDRSLLEFMYAVPREQLVRPGQRRSLMRRALHGLLPDELLNRKRKAYVARGPMTAISAEYENLVEMSNQMVSSLVGIINAKHFSDALHDARQGKEVPIVPLMRTVGIEHWLRILEKSNCVNDFTEHDHARSRENEDLQLARVAEN